MASINLTAGLDINSSDMLVDLGQETFQHNWQRWQGKCLPNSIRYEKNGWAAGWNVYNFEYNTFRKKLDTDLYLGSVQYNNDVLQLSLYSAYESNKAQAKYYVVKEPRRITGKDSTTLTKDTIKGTCNNKPYEIHWDSDTKTATMLTEGFSLKQEQRSDKSFSFTVTDITESIEDTFQLYKASALTSKSINNDVNYDSFDNKVHSWGQYKYNIDTNKLTTPEGPILEPTKEGNTIKFSYDYTIQDEVLDLTYSLVKYYVEFNNIYATDLNNEKNMFIGSDSTKLKKFNQLQVYPIPDSLVAEDDKGVIVDTILPVWATCGFNVKNVQSDDAKWCNNTKNNEVAIFAGNGIGVQVKYKNIFTGNELTEALVDNFRANKGTGAYPQYLENLEYRFNQILISNTIEAHKDWSPLKCTVNKNTIWPLNTKQYETLAAKDTRYLSDVLGEVYKFGSFTFKATDYFADNNPWDMSNPDDPMYKFASIGDILSVKLKGTPDNYNTGNDQEFITANLPSPEDLLKTYIADKKYVPTAYTESQEARTFEQLYPKRRLNWTSRTYDRYGYNYTYEHVGISTDPDSLWPFEYVPKFNLKLDDGTVINGCYYTDGENVITDLEQFKSFVLGTYDSESQKDNDILIWNEKYNRKRIVRQYNACYDFDYIRLSNYSDENKGNFARDTEAFNEVWQKRYPSTTSPLDYFDDTLTYGDDTYLNWEDIEVVETDPSIMFVKPGVYVFDDFALPYDNGPGIVLYDTDDFETTPFVYHHDKDVTNDYSINVSYRKGSISFGDKKIDLPNYFYQDTTVLLREGTGTKRAFTQRSSTGTVKGSKLELGINYVYDTHDDEWVSTGTKDSNWFKGVVLQYTHSLSKPIIALNDYVTPLDTPTVINSSDGGVYLGVPIAGHAMSRITFPAITKEVDLNKDTTFTFSKVDTADLAVPFLVYLDRDDTPKSQLLVKCVNEARSPDNGNGKGDFNIKLSLVNGSHLYYAKRKVNNEGKEVLASFYLPGIVFGDADSTQGNMDITDDDILYKLNWDAIYYNVPESATVKLDLQSQFDHVFYTSYANLLKATSVSIDPFDVETKTCSITLNIDDKKIKLTYYCESGLTLVTGGTIFGDELVTLFIPAGLPLVGANIKIPLILILHYVDCTAKLCELKSNKLVLAKVDNNIAILKKDDLEISYDILNKRIISPAGCNFDISYTTDVHTVSIDYIVKDIIVAYMPSVYEGTINGSIVTFKYLGKDYTFDLSELDKLDNTIVVNSTDIRDTEHTKTIGRIDPKGQYQLIKQQWNSTVEVENFWWIDSQHILELNSYDLVLKRKTEELDDWMGDKFVDVYKVNRSSVLPTSVDRYFVTNVYNTDHKALFVTLKQVNDLLFVTLIDPHETFKEVGHFYIRTVKHEITKEGEILNNKTIDTYNGYSVALFNSYSVVSIYELLSIAEWSNTLVDNKIIFGCHLNNNFNQWSLVYDINTDKVTQVIQGYGYVGLHGDLTGGMIPADYFDVTKGFNSKVQDFKALNTYSDLDYNNLDVASEVTDRDRISTVDEKIVGTSGQQWYIKKELRNIVSHLLYKNGTFEVKTIPISNNYDAIYESKSFCSQILGDNFLCTNPLSDLLPFKAAEGIPGSTAIQAALTTALVLMGYPSIYFVQPRFSSLVYLQQTFGQYAYVHYNSSKSPTVKEKSNTGEYNELSIEKQNKQTDPVLHDNSYLFDKQKVSQAGSLYLDTSVLGLMAILTTAFSTAVTTLENKLSVNETQNQTATTEIGRKFVENAIYNTEALLEGSIISKGKQGQSLTSAVTGIKSLDMFYSTSDEQRVYAGPGFTEHQYVADCVSQSATDLNVAGSVLTLFIGFRFLTTLQLEILLEEKKKAVKFLEEQAKAMSNSSVCGTSVAGTAAATALLAAAKVLDVLNTAQEKVLPVLNQILDKLFGEGITCTTEYPIRKQGLTVEGKHKYGEKNETFMWPCWGVSPEQLKYNDESVQACISRSSWQLTQKSRILYDRFIYNFITQIIKTENVNMSSANIKQASMLNCGRNVAGGYHGGINPRDMNMSFLAMEHFGTVPFYKASCKGVVTQRTLPDDMVKVEGVSNFLHGEPFKNENIAVSEPVFPPSMQHDYVIDKSWDLSQYCTYGMQQWVAVKDTKVIDCAPSNMYVNSDFCGIAAPYVALEVKREISKQYMRPWAITPNTLAFNCTGYNSILDNKLYHAFDGISFRLVDLVGSPGMNKSKQTFWYAFQINDRLKRSNIIPANELQGNFNVLPSIAVDSIDDIFNRLTVAADEKGLEAGIAGEDKDLIRWALPIFTEHVSTLPAAVKTMTAMPLGVVSGITSLCVELANNQAAYKAPLSVDFTIGKNVYRVTEEYICSVDTQDGIDQVTDLIPLLGLKYIGATPTEAYFYSKSTRCYYTFSGSTLTKLDMMERFRDIQKGYWDFVNQEVVMPCLMTFKRLNDEIEDKDTETDNIIVPVLSKTSVSGELPPPITTIFNDRSWYKCVSLPSGFAYQGPNRVIINRSVFVEYMLESMKDNLGKWQKLNREKYVTKRKYSEEYSTVDHDVEGIDGWTYNPFILVTSPLGQSEDTDCLFEWTITFCWPVEMDLLYGVDNYACVNIAAETMTPGGKLKSRPTHVFLTKELFTRNGNYGYYSFKFQSKNGAGNRERLHIWSDQYIAISSIDCNVKVITSRRTEQLTQQLGVQKLKEL